MELNFTHRIKTFHCVLCNILCSRKGEFDRHISTQKHYKNANNGLSKHSEEYEKHITDSTTIEPRKRLYICECGKKYTGQSGLWKHRQLCLSTNEKTPCNQSENNIPAINDKNINKYAEELTLNTASDIQSLTKLVMEVVKNNIELQKLEKELKTIDLQKDRSDELTIITEKIKSLQDLVSKLKIQKQLMLCGLKSMISSGQVKLFHKSG